MTQHDSPTLKILLIEDNDIDVELIHRLCKRHSLDYPIIRARNGLEALKILERPDDTGLVQPYVILLDINMPMMDGFELLDHLTQHGPTIETPIYILSSSASKADIERSKSYQITGYLVKPMTHPTLLKIAEGGKI